MQPCITHTERQREREIAANLKDQSVGTIKDRHVTPDFVFLFPNYDILTKQ